MPRYNRAWYERNRERILRKLREERARDPEKRRQEQRDFYHLHKDEKRPEWRAARNATNKRAKDKVFDYYGRQCACCGETEQAFLAIDHIEGGGNKHRKETNGKLYPWLVRNGFPEGFQTLCHNCNFAKHLLGGCPHEHGRFTKFSG